MSKRKKLISALLVAFLIVVMLSFTLGGGKPVSVTLHTVTQGIVQRTVANTRAGTLKACRRAGISPSLGGQIANLPVKEGDHVKAGQILMELWNEDRLARVTLAKRESRATKARARQACVVAEVAEREASRLRKLRKKKLASEEATDRADGDARAQQAACTAARVTTEVSQARLDVAQALLDQTQLVAPFSGIVAKINGEVGEFVTPSPVGVPTPPAVDLVNTDCLYVSAPMDEVDAPEIRVGMPAAIALDAYKQRVFPGHVRRIAPYVLDREKQARTVEVEVEFDQTADNANMLPGYSADIEIILEEAKSVVRIPTESIIDGNSVLVFSPDVPLASRSIKTGMSNWAWTEVREGLKAGEQVVVSVDRTGVQAGVLAEPDTQSPQDD